MAHTIHGKPIHAHYLAVFDSTQTLIGDAIQLVPPARIEMQMVGEQTGFQLWMPAPMTLVLSNPAIIGIAFLNKQRQFLVGFAIPGNPALRRENEEFVIRSRYIILAPKQKPS
jgi:hypothetical protein